MDRPVGVTVVATDPMLAAGAAHALGADSRTDVVAADADPAVTVVVADVVDEDTVTAVRAARDTGVVLVAADLEPDRVLKAVVAGARALLRRSEADAGRLVRTVLAVAGGDCAVPPDLLGRLLRADATIRPSTEPDLGRASPRLTERERAVLRLVAEGHETDEIARTLSYSTRTISGVVHDMTRRLRLRNRAHAVAYALRAGLL